MKKCFVLVLMGMVMAALLTGCGKSREERVREEEAWAEIAGHINEEAKREGVDLESMLQQEYADYEAARNERLAAQEITASSKEELKETYYGDLEELLVQYEASTDPWEIHSLITEYNDLVREMQEEAEALNIVLSDYYPVYRSKYLTRMAYFSTAQYKAEADTQMWSFYTTYSSVMDSGLDAGDPENYESVMVLVDNDEYGNILKITLIKNGTEAMDLVMEDYGISVYAIKEVYEDYIVFSGITNGDFLSYVFDYSGSSMELISDHDDMLHGERNWANTWEMAGRESLDILLEHMK